MKDERIFGIIRKRVTIQDSPKHELLRAYDSDLGVQNPIGEADFHGFCIRNCEGTEQLRKRKVRRNDTMSNAEAWDYAIGLIKVDGLEPTEDFKKYIEKEKRGEATMEDLKKFLDKKYKVKETVNA